MDPPYVYHSLFGSLCLFKEWGRSLKKSCTQAPRDPACSPHPTALYFFFTPNAYLGTHLHPKQWRLYRLQEKPWPISYSALLFLVLPNRYILRVIGNQYTRWACSGKLFIERTVNSKQVPRWARTLPMH